MKRGIGIVILLVALFVRYSAQTDTLRFKKIIVTTSLFSYLPDQLNSGCFNLGGEMYLSNNKSIGLNAGLIKSYGPSSGWFAVDAISTSGFILRVDEKHFFNRRKLIEPLMLIFWPHIFQYKSQDLQNSGYYAGADLSYQNTTTLRMEKVLDYVDYSGFLTSYRYMDNFYSVNRSVYAARLKLGYQCVRKSGFAVDFAVGLGLQYISSFSVNRRGDESSFVSSPYEIYWPKLFDTGAGLYPSVMYQFKLGWAF